MLNTLVMVYFILFATAFLPADSAKLQILACHKPSLNYITVEQVKVLVENMELMDAVVNNFCLGSVLGSCMCIIRTHNYSKAHAVCLRVSAKCL